MAVVLYVGVVLLECRNVVERVPLWRAWLLTVVALGAVVVLGNTYVGRLRPPPGPDRPEFDDGVPRWRLEQVWVDKRRQKLSVSTSRGPDRFT